MMLSGANEYLRVGGGGCRGEGGGEGGDFILGVLLRVLPAAGGARAGVASLVALDAPDNGAKEVPEH